MLQSINPAHEEIIQQYAEMSDAEVSKILDQSNSTYNEWKLTPFEHRSLLMKNASKILWAKKDELASLMTLEMGKPIAQSKAEVEKCAWVCDYYVDNAEKFLTNEIVKTEFSKSYISYQPLGVILAVMPWNFPFWQVFRFASPTLMAGNAGLLKHSSNVPGCSLAIQEIFDEAGFPAGVFTSLLIDSESASKLIDVDEVAAVTVTGSTEAGKKIAERSGKNIKKCVLELGGSDPFIVLDDVDVKQCAMQAMNGRILNSG